jgi:3-methyladenine DNA glycosylase AlkD
MAKKLLQHRNPSLKELINDLDSKQDPNHAKLLAKYFKTNPGGYGEGDIFLGIPIPTIRTVAKKYQSLSLNDLESLLHSKHHEKRFTSLILLVNKFQSSDDSTKKEIYNIYTKNVRFINNWDLVDCSAPKITGAYLYDKDRSDLFHWITSNNLWLRRIAILSTFYFIKYNDYNDSFKIAEKLIDDKEDLIHKALGWMIREIYKKDSDLAYLWIEKNADTMPRTMLRYSIEKVPEAKRKILLNKKSKGNKRR